MSQQQETIEDIIAEMRIFKCRNLETGKLELCNAIANYFADRLDTAHKREMSKNASKNGADFGQLGDCAKLREASGNTAALHEVLKPVKRYLDGYTVNILELRRTVDAALTAPARNCDRVKDYSDAIGKFEKRMDFSPKAADEQDADDVANIGEES